MMQTLQDRGILFGAAMRYRAVGQRRWQAGEAVEFDAPQLVFLCDMALELHVDVEILLPARVQVMGRDSPLTLWCAGRVVRRALANWPDLRSALVVRVEECRIAEDADYLGGAALRSERASPQT